MSNINEKSYGCNQIPCIMTVDEAARYLRVSPKTIYKAIQDGAIPAVRVGRALRLDRERLLSSSFIQKAGHR